MTFLTVQTYKLLNSASLVGFSGGLRLYLAFFLAGIAPNFLLIIASSLIIYATYTLDRALDNKEDEINHSDFTGANKVTGFLISSIAILIGTSLFFSKNIFLPPIFPFVVGILYSCGIPMGKKKIKLKMGFGIKNIVIGITWGGTIGLIIGYTGQIIAAMVISIYFGLKLFINSTIFDLKDMNGDLVAGIHTLPTLLDEKKLKYILFGICSIQHTILGLAMLQGTLICSVFFITCSFIASGFVIIYYSSRFEFSKFWFQRKFRTLAIDGESFLLVLLSIFLLY